MPDGLLVLGAADVRRHLTIADCIAALERAFGSADHDRVQSFVGGAHTDRGTFHIKAALASVGRPLFCAKLNGNFPDNARRGLPTIQGVLLLSDATNGAPLAIMDSAALTVIRTAAASGLVARYLAREDATTLALIGCGAQAQAQLAAMRAVRPVRTVTLHDVDADRCRALARQLAGSGLRVEVAGTVAECTAGADLIVTCTTAHTPFLDVDHVAPTTFVAAVGADNHRKSEITPALVAASCLVVDDADNCASSGDLHHALRAGLVDRGHVWQTVATMVRDRPAAPVDRPVLFDSTGIGLEDLAAAAVVYERALAAGDVPSLSLA